VLRSHVDGKYQEAVKTADVAKTEPAPTESKT
jgi:hypothetical protein